MTQLEEELKWLHEVAQEAADQAIRRLETQHAWFTQLPQQRRAMLGMLALTGIETFIEWYAYPQDQKPVISNMFGDAPRELLQQVSLQQTLQVTQAVVEASEELLSQKSQHLRDAVLHFSRDLAFASAHGYARAAEARGLWDARLEALIVDSIITGTADDELPSRIAALGWTGQGSAAVLIGSGNREIEVDEIRKQAHKNDCDVLIGLQGSRLLLVLGDARPHEEKKRKGAQNPNELFKQLSQDLSQHFLPTPLVLGPTVNTLVNAHISARAALNGLAVATAYRGNNHPIHADELLPERVIAGDPLAKRTLIDKIYTPLQEAPPELLETLLSYLASGRSLEATSREMFVHTNTVRYRLRRIYEIIGWQPTEPRDAFALQTALIAGQVGNSLSTQPERRSTKNTRKS
ncbi:MAG: helix-turn-helix domain-containing protein [Microbacteriaceae bacterium]|nr:helix-turn-helix domain-containing protein [Microbacteriaceae bacterium]